MDDVFIPPRTVTIPVRFGQAGEIHFFYGGGLPAIKEGTIGDLIVPAYRVLDERKLALLEQEETQTLIPKGTSVMALVIVRLKHLNAMAQDLRRYLKPKASDIYISDSYFIQIRLEADLEIRLRGTKLASLAPCECMVPALSNRRLNSLNQAFSAISEVYQQHRSTHVGNVFSRIYVQTGEKTSSSLGDLRDQRFRAVIEYRLLAMCRPWWYKTPLLGHETIWALSGFPENDLVTIYLMNDHSVMLGEQFFHGEDAARAWLKDEGFTEFDSLQSPKHLVQPEPPYRKPNGEEIRLSLERAAQLNAPSTKWDAAPTRSEKSYSRLSGQK